MVKKAITHLKLEQANPGKLQRLDELAAEYRRIMQTYVDWMIAHGIRQPGKYAPILGQDITTPLSDRWQRRAWQQACGIVRSWYSNARENPPELQNVCIQANTNVVVIEPSRWRQVEISRQLAATIWSVFGKVKYERAYYAGCRFGEGQAPLDKKYGLAPAR